MTSLLADYLAKITRPRVLNACTSNAKITYDKVHHTGWNRKVAKKGCRILVAFCYETT